MTMSSVPGFITILGMAPMNIVAPQRNRFGERIFRWMLAKHIRNECWQHLMAIRSGPRRGRAFYTPVAPDASSEGDAAGSSQDTAAHDATARFLTSRTAVSPFILTGATPCATILP